MGRVEAGAVDPGALLALVVGAGSGASVLVGRVGSPPRVGRTLPLSVSVVGWTQPARATPMAKASVVRVGLMRIRFGRLAPRPRKSRVPSVENKNQKSEAAARNPEKYSDRIFMISPLFLVQ